MKNELIQIKKKIFYLSNRDKSVSRIMSLTQRATDLLKKYRRSQRAAHYPTNLDLTISQLEANLDHLEGYENLKGTQRKRLYLSATRQHIWSDINTYVSSDQRMPL